MALTKQTQNGFGWLYNPKFDPLWQKRHLYSLATWTNGMAFRELEFSEVGRPIIKIAEIKNGLSGQTKYTEREYDPNYLITAGDMLFCWSGQPETSIDVYWWRNVDGWLNQHIFKVEPGPDVDRLFFFYVLRYLRPYFIAIARNKQTTGLGHVTKVDLERIEVGLPSKPEQRAIAAILGALDDKIELNRRMNETLEAMARAIFKSWFVDFDPVRAKMDGRWRRGQSLPGLPAELYDLFPDSFEDSQLGKIPKGWVVKRLSDLCSTQYGYTASAVDEPVGPKFLRVTDINKGNWIEWGDVPHCEIEPDARASYALRLGDVVVARMADPGKSAIIEEDIDAVFASYLVRLKTPSLAHSYYVYGFLKSDSYVEYAEGAKSGSVQANMNAKVIVGASLTVPPKAVLDAFLRAVLPLRERLVGNVREYRTLAAIRDALLPKLISGEIRVGEIGDSMEQL
jgi:type I restriction enzyme S subunit